MSKGRCETTEKGDVKGTVRTFVKGDGSLDNISTHSQYDRIRPVRQLSCLIIRQGLDEENEKRTPFQGGVKRTVRDH